ncbi:hypothetical protein BH23CHL7_BH23CHL7_10460 [soil metagenome]
MLATAVLALVVAPAALAAGGQDTVTVAVMKHACNPDVENRADFQAIVDQADGPIAALAATVLACPTVVNTGDETTDGVKADAADFSFQVEDENGVHQMPGNTMAAKLCETRLGLDADGDGKITDNVCLDISHYVFEGVANGRVTVTETQPPAGSTFGQLLFTPVEVDGNNDADSLVSVDHGAGVIELDTTADEDGVIMLHVYNFQEQMPDSSTVTPAGPAGDNTALLLVLALAAVGAAVFLATGLNRRKSELTSR